MRLTPFVLLAALSPSFVGDARAGTLKVPQQFPTIQAAVDAAVPGDVVKIASGTYAETVRVFSTHTLELRGEDGVTIDAQGLPGAGVQLTNVTGVRLRGLRVTDASAEGFLVLGSEAVVLEKCRAIDPGTYGVRVTSGSRAVWIDRPRIRGAALGGVKVEVATFVAVRDGRFDDLGGPAVETAPFSSHGTVTGNRFDLEGAATVVAGGYLDLLADNRTNGGFALPYALEGSAQAAVGNRGASSLVASGANTHLIDNRFTSPGASQVFTVWGGNGVVVYGNRSKGPSDVGLFDAGSDTVFASNRAKGVGGFGMVLYESSDAVFSGNRIAGKLGWAVGQYATSTGAVFLANEVKKKGDLGGVIGDGTAAFDLYAGNSFEGDVTAVLHVPAEYPTIQGAVDAAPAGAMIVVEAGVYAGNVSILGKHGLELRANGKVVVDSAGHPGPGLEIDFSSAIVVRGLRIRNEADDGVKIDDGVGVELDRVRVEDVGGAGFVVQGSSRGVRLGRCRISGSGSEGVRIESGSGVHVDRCRIAGTGGPAIETFATTRACVLERNRIDRELAPAGALVLDGVGHVVDRTRVTGSPNGLPIRIAGLGHTIRRTKMAGEFRVEGSRHRILDGRITTGPVGGIVLKGADDCLVAGNRIVKPSSSGIELRDGAWRNRILGNRVVRSGGNGIFVVLTSSENVVARNVVRRAGGNGIVFGAGTVDNAALVNDAKKSDGVDGWDVSGAIDNRWVANDFGTTSSIP